MTKTATKATPSSKSILVLTDDFMKSILNSKTIVDLKSYTEIKGSWSDIVNLYELQKTKKVSGLGNEKIWVTELKGSGLYVYESDMWFINLVQNKNDFYFIQFGDDKNNIIRGTINGDTLIGEGGNDRLIGGNGDDLMFGGLGKDTLTGGAGADAFVIDRLTYSVLSSFDVFTDLRIGTDEVGGEYAVSKENTKELGSVKSLSATDVGRLLTPSTFDSYHAATFTFGRRTFLAINDGVAGFQAANDAIAEITGYSGDLRNLEIV